MRKWPLQLTFNDDWARSQSIVAGNMTRIAEFSKEVVRLVVYEVDASVSPTFQLPVASESPVGYYIIKSDSSGTAVTVQCAGTDTVSGATTLSLATQYTSATLLPGVGRWYRV